MITFVKYEVFRLQFFEALMTKKERQKTVNNTYKIQLSINYFT